MGKRAKPDGEVGFVSGKRGGRKQRLEAEARAQQPLRTSLLAEFLLGLWSWGFMSPQTIQKIMSRAKQDLEAAMAGELDMSLFDELANIGTSGTHSRNCSRDLKQMMAQPKLAKSKHTFQIPTRSPTNIFHIMPYIHNECGFVYYIGNSLINYL